MTTPKTADGPLTIRLSGAQLDASGATVPEGYFLDWDEYDEFVPVSALAEARATAERDVAALRDAIRYGDDAARMAALAETAHRAEPRWPSGPDAERELAAQLRQMGYGYGADNPARAILASLLREPPREGSAE